MTERWTASWDDLVTDVLDPAVCSGCAGCVIVCPKQAVVLDPGTGLPVLVPEAWANGDGRHCVHAARGCTLCARVCTRFRLHDDDLRGISYFDEDPIGPHRSILLVQATDPEVSAAGQDGGLGSALLIYALEHDLIDAALVSGYDGEQRPEPRIARTRDDVLASAGSRYTYSANTLAYDDAGDALRLGLITVGCQASIPAVAGMRGARKLAKRFALTIGLLCSKTFTDDLFGEMLAGRYGVARGSVTKVNIKGRLQVWHDDGYLEAPLKECHAFTRPACNACPDFTAVHADLSLGGIGARDRTTLTIVRSDLGAELIARMEAEGLITVTDATVEDPDAVALIRKMAARQQRRWPATVVAD
jgi:coenzyme F420 hydrogenase subunit beta